MPDSNPMNAATPNHDAAPHDAGLPGVDFAEYDGPGYQALLYSAGDWMAAIKNGDPKSWAVPDTIDVHPDSDELFVLVSGRAIMVSGGTGENPGALAFADMRPHVLYNVNAGTWHVTISSPDAKYIIVEGRDAFIESTRKIPIPDHLLETISLETTIVSETNTNLPGVDVSSHNAPGYAQLLMSNLDWTMGWVNGGHDTWDSPPVAGTLSADELIVLLTGRARISVRFTDGTPSDSRCQNMRPGALYLVRAGTEHAVSLSEDARCLIIRQKDGNGDRDIDAGSE